MSTFETPSIRRLFAAVISAKNLHQHLRDELDRWDTAADRQDQNLAAWAEDLASRIEAAAASSSEQPCARVCC